eukprot:scaffold29740_cov57-Phaeocystis_antarctica.AAC.1
MDFLRGKPEAGAIDVRLVREVEWRGVAGGTSVFGRIRRLPPLLSRDLHLAGANSTHVRRRAVPASSTA